MLRPWRHSLRNAQSVSREDTADVGLVGGEVGEAVIAVARHQMPLGAEIMVHAGGKEVAALRSQDVGLVADDVDVIADCARESAAA